MKTTHILLMAAALLLGFTSCSDDTESHGSEAVQLSVSVGSITRTMPHIDGKDFLFANGDIIRLFVRNGYNTDEYKYQYEEKDGVSHWKPLGESLLWKRDMHIRAVYPGNREFNYSDTETDQSTEAAFLSSDLMKCEMNNVNRADDGILRIKMERQMALVQVRYVFGNEFEGLNPQILGGNVRTVSSAYEDGTFYCINVTPFKYESADGTVTYNALTYSRAAQPEGDFLRFDVQTGGGQRSYVVKGIPQLDKGTKYLINVRIGKDKAVIENITAEPWTESATSDLTPDVQL